MKNRILAGLLSFCLLLGLLPASALAADPAEHTHNADGWTCTLTETGRELTCGLEEHTHTEACYTAADPVLVCTQEEHTHGQECRDAEGNLTCTTEEHQHGDSCWQAAEAALTCGLEEHTHAEECWIITGEWNCIPPQDESSSNAQDDENTPVFTSLSEVWIDGKNGNDTNSGASIDAPVKTIQKAMELAGEGGTIIVKDTVMIQDENDLVLENVTIKRMDNDTDGASQEIYIKNSSVTLRNITIDGNKEGQSTNTAKKGYLIDISDSNVAIEDETLIRNYSGYAAMRLTAGSTVTMNGGEFTGNESSDFATIYIAAEATFIMNDGYIHGNVGSEDAAGAFLLRYDNSAKLEIHGGVITQNTAHYGAIYSWGGTLTIDGGKITDNKGTQGGAIGMYSSSYGESPKTTISGTSDKPVTITGNSSRAGGAISVSRGTLDIRGNVEITRNSAPTNNTGGGGGLYIDDGGDVTIGEGVILCNNKGSIGPDIAFYRGTLQLPDAKRMNQKFGNTDFLIDGWYNDDWIATEQNTPVEPGKLTATGFLNQHYQLVAAYTAHRVIYRNYQSGTEGATLPAREMPSLPTDEKAYLKGETAPLKQLSKTQFVGPKSATDSTLGVWTFKGWKYNSWNGDYNDTKYTVEDYICNPVPIEEQYLVKRPDTRWNYNGTGVMLTGIWEWSNEVVPWYYEVYYQADGTSWTKLTQGPVQGGTESPGTTVSIAPENMITQYQNAIQQQDLLTGEQEQLGTQYVFDSTYPQEQRLTAQAGEASQENPLKIYFRAAQHKITYEYEGTLPEGATDELPEERTASYREPVRLEEPELTGYSFSGWRVKSPEGAQHLLDGSKLTMPNADVTLVGSWTERLAQHTVTFDSNGGSPVPAQTVTAGDRATEPEDPTRDGYDFAGWYLCEVKYDFDTPVTEDITLVARWTERLAQHTVTFDSAGGSPVPTQTVTAGKTATEPENPTRRGYDFDGWYLEGKKYNFDTPVTADITLVARWSRQGGGSEAIHYILSYDSNGGTRYKDETYRKNTVVKLDKVPVREGYTFTGWYADKALTRPIDEIKMTSDKTVYAGWTRSYIPGDLNHRDHIAYVSGYPDGTVRPNASVTRAETATMLYRLLTDARREEIETAVIPFHDVTPTSWYAQAVAAMANGGYITGYEDGTFGGNKPITRAEFVAMLVRFIGLEEAQCSFTDVSRTHWAYEHIATATAAEWIGGYPDGTFGPSRSITRAEAMTIINRVLDRGVNEESTLLDFKVWPDNSETAWFYYEVIEATNDHEYTGSRPSEDWTRVR